MKEWLNKFLFVYVSVRNPDYRRLITYNFILVCTFFALLLFNISNFINENWDLFYNTLVIFVAFILLLLLLQGKKWLLIHSTLTLLGVGYLVLIYRHPGLQYIANWALIFSYILMVVYGPKRGGLLAVSYFTLTLLIMCSWVGKSIDFSAFLRFAVVGGCILFLSYITEMLIHRVVNRLASSQARLKHLSITDDLTHIYNRRHFDKLFTKELYRNKSEPKQLAFAMIDIDYFKPYNDFYGHQEGDVALIKVAKLLRFKLQQLGYYAFRIGGEEFALLFYVNDLPEALAVLQALQADVAKLKIAHQHSPISEYLTISAGLMVISSENSLNEEDLYQTCDTLLYQAKERGRNQIVY